MFVKTEMNMAYVSSHRCLGHLLDHLWSEKGVPAKEIYFLEEINLSRQKQSYHFYLFYKSWNCSVKNVIYKLTSHFTWSKIG